MGHSAIKSGSPKPGFTKVRVSSSSSSFGAAVGTLVALFVGLFIGKKSFFLLARFPGSPSFIAFPPLTFHSLMVIFFLF